MAEQVFARAVFFGIATTACLLVFFSNSCRAAEETPLPDTPAVNTPGAESSTRPASTPYEDLAPPGLANPLDTEGRSLNDAGPAGLDAIPELGESPAAGPSAESALPETDAPDTTEEAPEPLPAGTGLESFYTLGNVPDFIYNTSALTLPYTVNPNVSLGKGRTRIGPFRVGVNLALSTAYNTNVFGSPSDPQGDIVSTATPSFFIQAGTRGSFRLLYTPSFQYYNRFKTQNSANETLLMSSSYKFTKLTLGMDFGYTTRNGLFPDANGTANQSNYNLDLHAGYRVGAKTSLRLGYSGQLQSSDPGGDVTTQAVTLSSNYRMTPRIGVGGTLTGGYVDSQENQQTYVVLGAQGNWRASSKLQFTASGGVEARQLATGEANSDVLISPVFNLSAGWAATQTTSLNVNLFRNVSTNGFDTLQTNINTGLGFGASHTLWRKLSLQASGGLAYTEQVNTNGSQSDDYTYFYGSLSIGYSFHSLLNTSLFWNYQNRVGQSDDLSYTTNIFGISVGTNF